MSKDSTKTKAAYIDKPSILEQYKDLKDYLSHELSHHEYTNLYRTLGYNHQQKLARLLNGHTPWSFNNFLKLIDMLENPIIPSEVIKHFKINHSFTEYELNAIDSALIEG